MFYLFVGWLITKLCNGKFTVAANKRIVCWTSLSSVLFCSWCSAVIARPSAWRKALALLALKKIKRKSIVRKQGKCGKWSAMTVSIQMRNGDRARFLLKTSRSESSYFRFRWASSALSASGRRKGGRWTRYRCLILENWGEYSTVFINCTLSHWPTSFPVTVETEAESPQK